MAASILWETPCTIAARCVVGPVCPPEPCSRSDTFPAFHFASPICRVPRLLKSSRSLSNAHALSSPRSTISVSTRRRTEIAAAGSSEASVQTLDVPLESEMGVSYETLRDLLAAGEWESADNETRRLLCVLAGEEAAKRKWVYFTEVQFIPKTDLLTIDTLWRKASNDRFGFTIQRRMWNAFGRQYKPFFLKIGWTYGDNSTYKKFPLEFTWDISAPVGHLPLTNALRGTRLIESVFTHPAFDKFDAENTLPISDLKAPESKPKSGEAKGEKKPGSVLGDIFKTSDYGF